MCMTPWLPCVRAGSCEPSASHRPDRATHTAAKRHTRQRKFTTYYTVDRDARDGEREGRGVLLYVLLVLFEWDRDRYTPLTGFAFSRIVACSLYGFMRGHLAFSFCCISLACLTLTRPRSTSSTLYDR